MDGEREGETYFSLFLFFLLSLFVLYFSLIQGEKEEGKKLKTEQKNERGRKGKKERTMSEKGRMTKARL